MVVVFFRNAVVIHFAEAGRAWGRRTVLVAAGAASCGSCAAATPAGQRQRAAGAQGEESSCSECRQA
jgi:hypothetical protein